MWYIDFLVKKGVLDNMNGEVFKGEILNVFGEDKKEVDSESLKKAGFIASPKKKINAVEFKNKLMKK